MANSFPGSGLAYADAFSVGTSGQQDASLYVCSSCVRSAVIENTYAQTNLHHNTLWLRQNNSSGCNYSSIGFTVVNNGGDHHRANIVATGNSGTTGGNLALYTRNNNGNDTLGLHIDHAGTVGIGTNSPSLHSSSTGLVVRGSARGIIELWDATSGKSVFQNVSGDTYIGQLDKGTGGGRTYLLVNGNGTSADIAMTMLANSNIGIGTSCPQSKLHVEGGQIRMHGLPSDDVTGCSGYYLGNAPNNEAFQWQMSCNFNLSLWTYSVTNGLGWGLRGPVITQTGRVGIGTSSPSKTLHVYTTGNEGIFLQGTQGGVWMDMQSAGGQLHSIGAQVGGMGIYNRTNSSYRFFITDEGNVGINTTSPSQKFHVAGTSLFTDTMNFELGKISWNSTRFVITSCGTANIALATDNFTDRMTIQCGTGNVGIGTSSPNARLHVQGSSADGTATFRVTSTSASDSFNYAGTIINGCLCSNRNYILLIGQDLSNRNAGYIGYNHTGTTNSNNNFLTFGHYQSDNLLNLLGNGNLGVGTTTPSYRLHVNGTFYAAGSSIKYKEGICNYDTDSCLFMCLKPVAYQYKDEFKHLGKELKSDIQIGLIAEDVADVMPELAILVNEEDNKVVRNVDYEKLSIVLLAEVQKLRQEMDQLKAK